MTDTGFLLRNVRCPIDKGLLHGTWEKVTCDICGETYQPVTDLGPLVRSDEVLRFTTTTALVAMTTARK